MFDASVAGAGCEAWRAVGEHIVDELRRAGKGCEVAPSEAAMQAQLDALLNAIDTAPREHGSEGEQRPRDGVVQAILDDHGVMAADLQALSSSRLRCREDAARWAVMQLMSAALWTGYFVVTGGLCRVLQAESCQTAERW